MKINHTNKALLLEADNKRSQLMEKRINVLQSVSKTTGEKIAKLNIVKNFSKLNEYIKILDRVSKLCVKCVDISKKNYSDEDFNKELKQLDNYIKQIVDSVKQDKLVAN